MLFWVHRFLLCMLAFVVLIPLSFASPGSFPEAKRIAKKLFSDNRQTLYCACQYDQYNEIDLASCHMESASPIKRAHRVEWEHMMPAENFGKYLTCWKEKVCSSGAKKTKGRKCCEKIDAQFNTMEAELYNLWPAVGLVNQARSNYRYSIVEGRGDFYGCDFKVDSTLRKAEPADRVKGIVARANLFMAEHYEIGLSSSQKQLFEAWNQQYPPSEWEKRWALKVAEIEGYQNHYITDSRYS